MLIFRKILDKYWFNRVFLFIVLFVYFIGFLVNFNWWIAVWKYFLLVFFKSILSVLLVVYFLIFLFNILIDNSSIKNFFNKWNYILKLFFSVIWWILSSWSVYLWYPLLRQIKEKWLTYWHIAAFIYARAIKIPLLVMMVSFFWWKYTLIFNLVIFVFSFLVGIVVDVLLKFK